MVGEGVLLECLENPAVERVLSVSRRPCGHTHRKLTECLVPDFRQLAAVEAQLTGHDACFYCAGVSSVGMTEAEYTAIAYDTALAFAQTVARLNPGLVMVHVSGAHTDGSEQGRVMWARVKGKAENALARLPFKAVYNFRPSLMKTGASPEEHQAQLPGGAGLVPAADPVLSGARAAQGRPGHDQLRALRRVPKACWKRKKDIKAEAEREAWNRCSQQPGKSAGHPAPEPARPRPPLPPPRRH